MYEMKRRKPEHTLLPTEGIFNRPYYIGMVREELAFDGTVSYTQQRNDYSTASSYSVTGI